MEKNLFTCNQVSASTWWRGTADSSAFLMKPRVVSGGSLSGVSKGSKIFLEKFKRNVTVYRKLPIQFRICLISAWYSNCFEIGEKYLKYEAPFHPETNLRQQNFKPSQIFWRDICLDRFHPLGHDNLPHLKRFGEQITNELFKHNQSTFQEITPQKNTVLTSEVIIPCGTTQHKRWSPSMCWRSILDMASQHPPTFT